MSVPRTPQSFTTSRWRWIGKFLLALLGAGAVTLVVYVILVHNGANVINIGWNNSGSAQATQAIGASQAPWTAAPSQAPETITPSQAPGTATAPEVQKASPGFPADAAAVADMFGGQPADWSRERHTHNGWVYRSSTDIRFTVPDRWAIDTSSGRHYAGEAIDAFGLTAYWIQ